MSVSPSTSGKPDIISPMANMNTEGNRSANSSCPSWYVQDIHLQERRKMITNIARLLQARKPNAPAEWMQKLPQMARRLEESLFRSAVSFDDYRDTQTLKKRLQALAIAMGLRAQQQKQKTAEDGPTMASSGSSDLYTDVNSHPAQNLDDAPSQNIINPCAATRSQSSEGSGHTGDLPLTVLVCYYFKCQTIIQATGTKRLVALSEIHPLVKCGGASEDGGSHPLKTDPGVGSKNAISLGTGGALHDAATVQRPYHADQRQQVLRQQQQRLLLLRHASKCPHENGSCPVTPHCVGMKRLWKHIAECKDQQCQMAHCVSSRYVLSHYHRCKDPRCAVCGPVREAIQRNHEKAKQLAMAQPVTVHVASNARDSSNDLPAESVSRLGQPSINGRVLAPSQRLPSRPSGNERTSRQRNVTVKTAKGFNIGYGYGVPPNTLDSKNSRVNVDSTCANRITSNDARGRLAERCTSLSSTSGRVEEGTSLLNSFTPSQIHAHLQSLKTGLRLTSAKIRQKCFPVLKKLLDQECSWIFMQPVDPVELNLPDYFEIIEIPMDLGTIKKKMENSSYKLISEFVADVRLTFDNAITYNGDGSDVCKVARDMKMTFEKLHSAMIASIDAEEEQRKSSGDVCVLCGCEKLLFEPTVYYCNGSCNGQRIRRNSYYYTGGRNQYHWCQQCFNELKEKDPLEFPDCTLFKKELQKKKNDEMHEEPWVECSQCNRWVHQICALFNGRMNKGTTIYHCPFCFMARRSTREPHPKPLAAKDIRHTTMSRFLEDRVIKCLDDAYTNVKNGPLGECERSSAIYVRQLSNIDKMHQAKPRMLRRYTELEYPREFPARSKCVLLFQEMDGVDVILFGMYLYEYGHRCPLPNQRCVYVSYLDSVYYFRPRQFRTMVYHEMLIAYLAHVKQRGFHTAHIWACPPCKGDDYIFFCHPEDQKTPKDDRLRSWYITLLETAKTEGIVTHITNIWKEHFKSDRNATIVPYFEGDYWPGEAENVIKAIDEEAHERNDPKARKAGNSVKSKAKGRFARGLRSDGSAEEEKGQDSLVLRMGKILEPMKDAFIVAYLGPRKFATAMARRYTTERRPMIESEMTSELDNKDASRSSPGMTDGATRPHDESPSKPMVKIDQCDKKTSKQTSFMTGKQTKNSNLEEKGKYENSMGKAVFDETEDTDEIIESEFYDTRQQFLNLCQGNHYQFDELRRAKHTSMMSLYHLHNPDVPKFLVTCSNCNMDINVGYCYNSEKDPEFHLCQDCYQKTHKLYADRSPFRRSLVGGDSQAQLTEEQRRDRQRSIQLHMQLLQHASGCQNQQCPSANCNKMKNLLKHGATCMTRVQGGCAICRRIWALLQIHARQCRRDTCMVPKCRQLKEQLRALAQQQAQMDERRRAAMNAAYSRPCVIIEAPC